MATISQRISLEGSEDIRKKLEALGVAGEKAFKQIQDAAKQQIVDPAAVDRTRQAFEQLAQATARLSPQFKELAADTQTFGAAGQQATQQVTAGLNQTTQAAREAGASLLSASQKFGIAAVGIVTAISAIVNSLTKGAGETAQTISSQADKLTLTIGQWLKLKEAIDQAGGSAEDFIKSTTPLIAVLNKLALETSGKRIFEFADGTKVTVIAFESLSKASKETIAELQKFGVTLDDIKSGDVEKVIRQIADFIDRLPESAAKAAAGFKAFGVNWKSTIAVLLAGKKPLDDTTDAIDRQRIASRQMSEAQVVAAKKAADQWDDLFRAIRATKDLVGALFSGLSFARAKWLTDLVDDARMLLKVWLGLEEAERRIFEQTIPSGPTATAFEILIALGQQLAGLWRDVLVPAGKALWGIVEQIAASFNGISGSQVAAFFITAAIAAAGLALALKGIALLLTPLSMLFSLVFSPLGLILLAAAAAAALFWDKLVKGANDVAALIPAELAAIGEAIKKLFAGDFSGFWKQFSEAAVSAFGKIMAAAEKTEIGAILIKGFNTFKEQLPGAIKTVFAALDGLGKAADKVAGAINKVFGTNISGTGLILLVVLAQVTGALKILDAVAIATAFSLTILEKTLILTGKALTLLKVIFFETIPAMLAFFATPPGLLLLAILAIVAAIALLIIYWPQVKQAALDAWEAIKDGANKLKKDLEAWIGTPVANAWQWVKDTFWNAVSGFKSMMDTVTGWIKEWVTTPVANAWQWIVDKWNAMLKSLGFGGGAGARSSGVPPDTSGGQKLASGGYIRGPGTATSDSILARLSNGEFVLSARAVQHWGVNFLSRLNNLQAPRFSMGGLAMPRLALAMPQMPRFAEGGLVQAAAMPHLGTVDLTTNHGQVRVSVDSSGLSQLRKAAVMRNMGTDRKPGWVR